MNEQDPRSGVFRIDLGNPVLLEFRGPDALRFLNGQITQDVRLVDKDGVSLPACVTDAKGRLQFRVWLTGTGDDALWVDAPAQSAAGLEARLSRYLIADDVEVSDLTGKWSLVHFTGIPDQVPEGVRMRASRRFGVAGMDWWIPAGREVKLPAEIPVLEGDMLEAFRIRNGVPAWGRELTDGLLPPEAGLDATDISYQKGCYIGQEVISRIKSAGKVNKQLVRMTFDSVVPVEGISLVDHDGQPAGVLTSVSAHGQNGLRHALGFVKRGMDAVSIKSSDGTIHPILRMEPPQHSIN